MNVDTGCRTQKAGHAVVVRELGELVGEKAFERGRCDGHRTATRAAVIVSGVLAACADEHRLPCSLATRVSRPKMRVRVPMFGRREIPADQILQHSGVIH